MSWPLVVPDAAVRHYRSQQRRTLSTLLLTRRTWREMGPDFDGSWRRIGRTLSGLVRSSQLGAAKDSASYLPDVLDELDLPNDPDGDLVPEAFADVAGDGRDLDSLLYGAVTKAKQATQGGLVELDDGTSLYRPGASVDEALAAGEAWLDMAVQTAIADAERAATSVGIAVRRDVGGWVRMLNPPSCDRCAILAGRWYRWSDGFLRHPQCDCRMVPANEAGSEDLLYDAAAAVRAGQVTGLSKADTRAIVEDDANPSSVVNAKRGMYSAGTVKATRAGRSGTRRGPRLRPEAIYDLASDRDDAIRLLRLNGYVR